MGASAQDVGLFALPRADLSPLARLTWTFDPNTPGDLFWFNGSSVWVQKTPPFFTLNNTSAPTVSTDNTLGYAQGSIYVDSTHNQVYICSNAATGAAVWTQISNSALSSLTVGNLSNVFTATFNPASSPMLQFSQVAVSGPTWSGNNTTGSGPVTNNTGLIPQALGGAGVGQSSSVDRLLMAQHTSTANGYSSLTSSDSSVTINITNGNVDLKTNAPNVSGNTWVGNATGTSGQATNNSFGSTNFTVLGLNGSTLPAMLNFVGAGGTTVSGSGNTITITGGGGGSSGWKWGGTGSQGAGSFPSGTSHDDDGTQYDFTTYSVSAGATHKVPHHAVIQCTGTANVAGTLKVQPGMGCVGGNGGASEYIKPSTTANRAGGGGGGGCSPNGAGTSPGGAGGGDPLGELTGGLGGQGGTFNALEGGAGGMNAGVYSQQDVAPGGTVSIAAVGAITVSGTINTSASATAGGAGFGGGSGGVANLMSQVSISLTSTCILTSNGQPGGNGSSTVGNGGGGGCGLVVCYAPVINIDPAVTYNFNGGAAGTGSTGTSASAGTSITDGNVYEIIGTPVAPYISYDIKAAEIMAALSGRHRFKQEEVRPLALSLMDRETQR